MVRVLAIRVPTRYNVIILRHRTAADTVMRNDDMWMSQVGRSRTMHAWRYHLEASVLRSNCAIVTNGCFNIGGTARGDIYRYSDGTIFGDMKRTVAVGDDRYSARWQ